MFYLITLYEGRGIEQPQLDYTLVKGVRLKTFMVANSRVIFGLDYLALASTVKFDFWMRLVQD